MRIALISSYKNLDFNRFICRGCTEIVTNIPNLDSNIQGIPIIYNTDVDELIKNADWVTIVCGKSLRGSSTVISKCRKYHVSVETINADAFESKEKPRT